MRHASRAPLEVASDDLFQFQSTEWARGAPGANHRPGGVAVTALNLG
jgi:hypothetical protein